jgi:CHAT domain-containing protein
MQAKTAESISQRHFSRIARGLEEGAAFEYLDRRAPGLDLLIELSRRDARLSPIAFDALIRGRMLVLQEMMQRQRLVAATTDRRTQTLAAAVIERRAAVAQLALSGPQGGSQSEFLARLEQTEADAAAAERNLARRSQSLSGLAAAQSIGLAELRTALPDRSALVAVLRYGELGPAGADMQYAEERYAAFVLNAENGQLVHVDLGAIGPLDQSATSWFALLRVAPDPLRRAAAERELRAAGLALRSLLFDPIAPYIRSARRVFVVADPSLGFVPWAALPNETMGYLLESPQSFHLLSSERDLVEFLAKPRRGSGLLAVGGIDFGQVTLPCATGAHAALAPLPGSLHEAESSVAFWQSQLREPVQLLRGAEATEARLRALAPGRRVLHLATHGFFVDTSCTGSETPLAAAYRGGIVLAAAHDSAGEGHDDGWLTAGEIAGLDWHGTECAVISACRSGYGQVDATGAELLGLQRALRVAGVATVVTSLWEVEDGAAREWMAAFYAAKWQRRLPLADAMRDASLELVRLRRARGQSDHPAAWANFVAIGDWR